MAPVHAAARWLLAATILVAVGCSGSPTPPPAPEPIRTVVDPARIPDVGLLKAALGSVDASPELRALRDVLGPADLHHPLVQRWDALGLTINFAVTQTEVPGAHRMVRKVVLKADYPGEFPFVAPVPGFSNGLKGHRSELRGRKGWAFRVPTAQGTHRAFVVPRVGRDITYEWTGRSPRAFAVRILGRDALCTQGTCVDGGFEAQVTSEGVDKGVRIAGSIKDGRLESDEATIRHPDGSTYNGYIDSALRPHGWVELSRGGTTWLGKFSHGARLPGITFTITDRFGWVREVMVDAELRPNGPSVTWHRNHAKEGPRQIGRFAHGVRVGRHFIRECASDDCAVVREVTYNDAGEVVAGTVIHTRSVVDAVEKQRLARKHEERVAAWREMKARERAYQKKLEQQRRDAEAKRRQRVSGMERTLDARVALVQREAVKRGLTVRQSERFPANAFNHFFVVEVPRDRRYKLVVAAPPGTLRSGAALVNQGRFLFSVVKGGPEPWRSTCNVVPSEGTCWINFSTHQDRPRPGEMATYAVSLELYTTTPGITPPIYVAVLDYGK